MGARRSPLIDCAQDQESHAPTSMVSDCEPSLLHIGMSMLRLPFPVLVLAPESLMKRKTPRAARYSGLITKGDLLAMQDRLLQSFSVQFGQNVQAINTRLDLGKAALEGRLDSVQWQLLHSS
eukprot:909728-Amphidinium_carterae.5